MTHTAGLALTVVCFVVALAAQLLAVVLVVSEVRAASRALRAWEAANPVENPEGSALQHRQLNDVVRGLLGSPFDRGAVVGLVVTGILVGATGNFLALTL